MRDVRSRIAALEAATGDGPYCICNHPVRLIGRFRRVAEVLVEAGEAHPPPCPKCGRSPFFVEVETVVVGEPAAARRALEAFREEASDGDE